MADDPSTPDIVFEDTLETPLGDALSPSRDRRPKVELVAGERPRLATETQELLRQRLRIAVLILLFANVFFTARVLLGMSSEIISGPVINVYRIFSVLALSACTVVLWSRPKLGLRELRALEVIVFGVPLVLFVAMNEQGIREAALSQDGMHVRYSVLICMFMWFVIIVIYGTFIPNSLRRAATVMVAMGIVPVGLILIMAWRYRAVGDVVFGESMVPEMFVALGMILTTAIYGSYKVGALRKEVFAARQMGQYRLLRRIGSGGMGEVYLAEHQLLKRPCAVKLIHGGNTADGNTLARFEREVRSMARLSHWNSVEVFDYGRAEDGAFYYAMEYLPGLSLQEAVVLQGPMQPERAVHLLRQVCSALAEAHALGLVHRDIKPSNIIASHRGGTYDVAKLLDFGLATMIDDAQEVQLTQEGAIAGSPYYLAPERFLDDDPPDARSDIYSLGAVAYFLVCGRPPFVGDKPINIMIAHARETLVPPSQVNASVPADLEQVIVRCLAKSPDERYQDVAALDEALAACQCAGRWSQELAVKWWVARPDDGSGERDQVATAPAAS